MKLTLLTALISLVFLGCSKAEGEPSKAQAKKPVAQTKAPAAPAQPAAKAASKAPGVMVKGARITGTVVETMNAGSYTYVGVKTSEGQVWAAGPKAGLKVGDAIDVPKGMIMNQFTSKTLKRTFAAIYFLPSLTGKAGQPSSMPTSQPVRRKPKLQMPKPIISVEKAKGGHTVFEVFTHMDKLAGKEVKIRAKVVKYNGGILGKNWLHIQDGTGNAVARTNDLTVTTKQTAKVNDIVLIKGKVTKDKDFGGGYKYAVIIEDAVIEKQ